MLTWLNRIFNRMTPSSLVHGQTTIVTSGTRVQLSTTSILLSNGVTIKAKNTNGTGIIFIGGSTVGSSTGLRLAAGEQTFVAIDDLSKVYIDADTSGIGISYIGG